MKCVLGRNCEAIYEPPELSSTCVISPVRKKLGINIASRIIVVAVRWLLTKCATIRQKLITANRYMPVTNM